jgi:hypothetical protein
MKTVIMAVEAWALCSTDKKNRSECIRIKYVIARLLYVTDDFLILGNVSIKQKIYLWYC